MPRLEPRPDGMMASYPVLTVNSSVVTADSVISQLITKACSTLPRMITCVWWPLRHIPVKLRQNSMMKSIIEMPHIL